MQVNDMEPPDLMTVSSSPASHVYSLLLQLHPLLCVTTASNGPDKQMKQRMSKQQWHIIPAVNGDAYMVPVGRIMQACQNQTHTSKYGQPIPAH